MKNILAISFFFFSTTSFAFDCEGGEEKLRSLDGAFELWCEKDGVRHGDYELWSVETGLMVKAGYADGQLEGMFLRYGPDGTVIAEGRFHAGELVGAWTRHFPNGRLKDRGEWREGRPIGPWTFYSESGRQIRRFDFARDSLIPHWQFGAGVSRAEQPLGYFTSGVALITRCFWCENKILVPRFDLSVSWMKIQEEGVRITGGLHLGFDFDVGPLRLRPLFGFEYLTDDHLENSYGMEITRVIGERFRTTDFQPFLRYLHMDLGTNSDLDFFQAGLWIKL